MDEYYFQNYIHEQISSSFFFDEYDNIHSLFE